MRIRGAGYRVQGAVPRQGGVVALFLSIIIGILLMTITTYAARLSVSELSQSTDTDVSEQAYYAAEAGVEEAIRRIDTAPTGATLCQIFPEQFTYDGNVALGHGNAANCPANPTTQPGDTYDLSTFAQGGSSAVTVTTDDPTKQYNGSLAWRQRRVYQQSTNFFGTQVKDESEQFDLSDLCRRVAGQVYGTAACNPTTTTSGRAVGDDYASYTNPNTGTTSDSIFAPYQGLLYCWNNNSSYPVDLELTDIYFSAGYSGFQTAKTLLVPGAVLPDGTQITINPGTAETQYGSDLASYGSCAEITVANPTTVRHIFRIKALYRDSSLPGDQYSVSYSATIMEALGHVPSANPASPTARLYIPNDSYIIDVVGQVGDLRRRIIAKKLRSNKLLGVFDYVLYSGDPGQFLCKAGVQQSDVGYDTSTCTVGGSLSNDTTTIPPSGANKAAGKTVTTTSWWDPLYSQSAGFQLSYVTDGNTNTQWYPGNYNYTIVVDLGSAVNLSKVVATWGMYGMSNTYINSYSIGVSTDGVTYQTISSGGLPSGTNTTATGTYSNVRYIQVQASSSNNWIGLYEVQAY